MAVSVPTVGKSSRLCWTPSNAGPLSRVRRLRSDHLDHHPGEIQAVEILHIGLGVAASQKLCCESRQIGPGAHALDRERTETAPGTPGRDVLRGPHSFDLIVEVAADTDVIDADQIHH